MTCSTGDFQCGKDETSLIDVRYSFCTMRDEKWLPSQNHFDQLKFLSRQIICLSSDGQVLALGKPIADQVSLHDADGSKWIQQGRVLEGPLGSNFGGRISMSQGLRGTVPNHLMVGPVWLAVSGNLNDKDFVRILSA